MNVRDSQRMHSAVKEEAYAVVTALTFSVGSILKDFHRSTFNVTYVCEEPPKQY